MERAARERVRLRVRWMIRRDLVEVFEIEQRSFDYPWCEEDFLRVLRQQNHIGMVAEADDEKIVGHLIYRKCKSKLSLLNFAVHPQHRRRGVGTLMAEWLVGKLSSHRRARIVLEVRETNLDAQKFFRAMGYRATGVLRQFFDDTGEDAYIMECQLQLQDELPEAIRNRLGVSRELYQE